MSGGGVLASASRNAPSERSPGTASASPPAEWIDATRLSRPAALRPVTRTRAPSRARTLAHAVPRSPVAPVTRAVRPASSRSTGHLDAGGVLAVDERREHVLALHELHGLALRIGPPLARVEPLER